MSDTAAAIRSRIVGHGEEAADQLLANPANWRVHPKYQQEVLDAVLDEIGWVQSVIVNRRTGHLVDGHLRVQLAMRRAEAKVPVVYVDLSPEEESQVLAMVDPIAGLASTDTGKLRGLIDGIATDNATIRSMLDRMVEHAHLLDAMRRDREMMGDPAEAVEKGATDERRKGIDLVFTAGASTGSNNVCCLAVRAGWSYGLRSSDGACALATGPHAPVFIDNEFKDYDHAKHLDVVAAFRPKYATVRDVMSRAQCEEAGIPYYDLDVILKWAEDVAQHAEHVIVIPKVDCVDDIPAQHVIGYSVPSSYGGTPIPLERFRGRKIHLLGGSPNRQIAYWQAAPDDVVSLDNNYIWKMARYGCAWFPDGKSRSISELGIHTASNPLWIALAMSLGNMAGYFARAGDTTSTIEPLPAGRTVEEVIGS